MIGKKRVEKRKKTPKYRKRKRENVKKHVFVESKRTRR